jgi:uncharacterized repeat protein (TIGR01451 family)
MIMMRRLDRAWLVLGFGSALLASSLARAAVAPRFSVDQRGDVVFVGNVLAHNCADAVAAPVVGDVGACGGDAEDTGADVLWSVGVAGGSATASTAVDPAEAASIAQLALPAGAVVTRADLFWSAVLGNGDPTAATLGRGATQTEVVADETRLASEGAVDFYQSSADVTAFVREQGSGPYRLSGVEVADPQGLDDSAFYAAWWLVVFYATEDGPVRHLALLDGLEVVVDGTNTVATLSGFEIPPGAVDAKLGVIAYEGDGTADGDELRFGAAAPLGAGAALDGSENFFDGSRRGLSGAPLSVEGDLPQLTGAADSESGLDLHLVDVGDVLEPGQSSAALEGRTDGDRFILAGLVLSVVTATPDLSLSSESVRDVDGPPTLSGGTLEYTLEVSNSGSGAAVDVVLTQPLPAGVTFVPGSLRVGGADSAALTDAADGDAGELVADASGAQTLVVRLGSLPEGSAPDAGGELAAGASAQVTFQVVVAPDFTGSVVTQGQIASRARSAAAPSTVLTDSDLVAPGVTPTTIDVDACAVDGDCSASGGVCDVAQAPKQCVACLVNEQCPGLTPVCDASHTCVCVPTGPELACDGKDDDCNGVIDDGLAGVACSAGEGRCQSEGASVCGAGGEVICDAVPSEPIAELCDNAEDDDCDGATDAADSDCQGKDGAGGKGGDEGRPGQPGVPGDLPGVVDIPQDAMGAGVTPSTPGDTLARPTDPPPTLLEGSSGASLGGGGGGCGITPATPSTGPLLLGLGALLSLGWRRRRSTPRGSGPHAQRLGES